jgi:hypothetical protein
MSSDQIALELQRVEADKQAFAEQLDEYIVKFQEGLPIVAEAWIKKHVDSTLREESDRIEQLGLERLGELKRKLNQLISRLPEIVQAETSDKSNWPHYQPVPVPGLGGGVDEGFFNRTFRNVISHLGELLNEFGLVRPRQGHAPLWDATGVKTFRYALNPGFELNQVPQFDSAGFNKTLADYRKVEKSHQELTKQLSQAKARELWDKAE